MTTYLRIKNWRKHQHYGEKRSPPWIKLHRSLLADYDFHLISDASKAHLILIWLLASEHGGQVPNDPAYLRARLALKSEVDLEELIARGFLFDEALPNTEAEADSSLIQIQSQRNLTHASKTFEAFWKAYPRKRAKGDAFRAWCALAPSDDLLAILLAALERQRPALDEPKFIPYPASWIRDRRWEDEPDVQRGTTAAPAWQGCAYCERPGVGKVNGIEHCNAHQRDAYDRKPRAAAQFEGSIKA